MNPSSPWLNSQKGQPWSSLSIWGSFQHIQSPCRRMEGGEERVCPYSEDAWWNLCTALPHTAPCLESSRWIQRYWPCAAMSTEGPCLQETLEPQESSLSFFREYTHTAPDAFLPPPPSLTTTWKMEIVRTFTIKLVREIWEGGLPDCQGSGRVERQREEVL